jgi:hypothetical protein
MAKRLASLEDEKFMGPERILPKVRPTVISAGLQLVQLLLR